MKPLVGLLRSAALTARRVNVALTFRRRFGFDPPPHWSDLSGYESLLRVIVRERLYELDGDFVEIGAFLGGGTYKLCKLLELRAPQKRLYSIDVFAADLDRTSCTQGDTMAEIYARVLQGRDQLAVYKDVTRGCANLTTIVGDSAKVDLPCRTVAFAYVDGNHDPAYVRGDFDLVWPRVVSRGVVAFDDYGFDLPGVTAAIDDRIALHRAAIARTWTAGWKTIFLQKR